MKYLPILILCFIFLCSSSENNQVPKVLFAEPEISANVYDAEGNIIGSCIINFCLILGFGSILSIIELDSKSIENLIFLLFGALIIWLYGLSNSKHTLYKYHGISLLIIFAIYLLRLLVI